MTFGHASPSFYQTYGKYGGYRYGHGKRASTPNSNPEPAYFNCCGYTATKPVYGPTRPTRAILWPWFWMHRGNSQG